MPLGYFAAWLIEGSDQLPKELCSVVMNHDCSPYSVMRLVKGSFIKICKGPWKVQREAEHVCGTPILNSWQNGMMSKSFRSSYMEKLQILISALRVEKLRRSDLPQGDQLRSKNLISSTFWQFFMVTNSFFPYSDFFGYCRIICDNKRLL